MSTSANNQYDAVESLIRSERLRIAALDFHPELDMLLIILNTGMVLNHLLSAYPSLANADTAQLQTYELLGEGTGVHWPLLDEDLSLKGFLLSELRRIVGASPITIAQYNAEIEEAMKSAEAGEFYTHEQVKEMSKKWLNDNSR